MDRRAQEEVEREVAHDTDFAKTVAELYGLARGLVQFVPLPYAEVVKAVTSFVAPKHVEQVVRLMQKAMAYQTEKPHGIRGRGDAELRNRLRNQWAIRLAFLDEISMETIPCVLPKDDPEAVLAWFKREASLRAPTSERWTMRPMIRTKMREHVRNDSQAMHDELTRAAQGG
jgi:hypothetical protein